MFEEIDAQFFCENKVDFLKIDTCAGVCKFTNYITMCSLLQQQ